MPRPSQFERFLKQFPDTQRSDIEREVLRARDSKAAHEFLKNKFQYRFSYDSVKSWRQSRSKGLEGLSQQSSEVAAMAARVPLESDPIASVMSLAQELNSLCVSLTALLQGHQWLEPGEIRLSNREAAKILGALPSLARASAGSIVEMSRVKAELDQRGFALAILEEFSQDWQQALAADNPELIGLFESIARITKARLELDRPSALEQRIENPESPVSSF